MIIIQPNGRASEYNTVYDRLYHEGEDRKKEADEEVYTYNK